MTNKVYHTINDFLNDPSFKNWVLKTNLSDVSFWNYWINNNPDKKELVKEAEDIILGIQFKQQVVNSEVIESEWLKLQDKILENKSISKKNSLKTNSWIGIAASIVLLLSIGIRMYYFNDAIVKHTTGFGEILNLKLEDGSLVTLNANSSLSYSKDNYRKVKLKGEAYFQVDKKKTTNAKFWVITNDLKVEVYGTIFNVNTRKQKTQVFLKEGNIWLSLNNGKSRKMLPGNFISYSSIKNTITEDSKKVIANEKTSWKDGTLTFNNSTLEKVLDKITDTYGYEVIFKNPEVKNMLITGTVPTHNLDICLKAIEKSVNVLITKENTKLVVSKK